MTAFLFQQCDNVFVPVQKAVCYICSGVVLELKNGFGTRKELPAEVQVHVNDRRHLLNKAGICKQYEDLIMEYKWKRVEDSPSVLAHWHRGLEKVDGLENI